jgi:hypothetical protein
MIEVDNYKRIFADIHPSDVPDVVHIHEGGKQATVNDFYLEDPGTLFHFFPDVETKKTSSLWTRKCIYRSDADGIILFEKGAKKHIVVCELKTGCNQFGLAFDQATGCLVKIIMMLSVCDHFLLNDFDVTFIFAVKIGDEMLNDELFNQLCKHRFCQTIHLDTYSPRHAVHRDILQKNVKVLLARLNSNETSVRINYGML